MCQRMEPRRQRGHRVAVAHPGLQLPIEILEQWARRVVHDQLSLTELLFLERLDFAAELVGQELQPITNAQHWNIR